MTRRKAEETLLAELTGGKPSADYTPTDRYTDFRRVFLDTPEGKRVLWQILEWAHVFRISAAFGQGDRTFFREGERNIGVRLFTTLTEEPKHLPDRQAKGEK